MIKSKTKVISILALIMCMTFIAFIGVNAVNIARATDTAETQVFRMVEIASVRTKGNVGIRFTAEINKAKYESIVGAGNNDELPIVIEINRAENPVEGDAVTANLSVDASDFESQDIVQLKANLTFGNASDVQKASALQLKAICYAEFGGEEIPADGDAVQDMRSVAHFNDLRANEDVEKLDEYYGESTEISGELNYLKGTSDSVSVTLDGFTATSVYVNTIKVAAAISGNTVTIAKSDIANAWIESENNYVQIFDNANNVCYQKLTDVIETASAEYFSAIDGEIDAESIFGAGAVIVKAETLSNNAVEEGEFATLTVTDGLVKGLETKRTGFTTATIRLSTQTDTKDVTFTKIATKIIEDAEDMEIFEISSTNENFVFDGTYYKMDGYFVLANDVTLNAALIHDTIPNDVGDANNTYWQDSKYGFKGVFDGQGYTLTAPIEQKGLFGALSAGAVVQNTSFNLTASIGSSGWNASGLFHQFSGAIGYESHNRFSFENLWIKVSGQSANFSPIASRGCNCYYYTDVFVDLSDLDCSSGYIFGNSFVHPEFNKSYVDKLSGITVVSERPFLYWGGINVVPVNMYDAFDGIEYVPGTTAIESGKTYKYRAAGVNQYASLKELVDANVALPAVDNGDGVVMKADKSKVDLGESATITLKDGETDVPFTLSVSNANFTVSGNTVIGADNGYAVITASYTVDGKEHSKTMFMLSGSNVINYNTQATAYSFSAVDGDMPSGMLADGETIVKAVADNQTLTVENNKVKGFKLTTTTVTSSNGFNPKSRDAVTSALITIYTSQDNCYKLYVKAYTKTIDSAEDMLYFNLDTEKTLSGTYIMTNNVEITEQIASQITHDAVTSIADVSYGFDGLFDGDGYTLSGYIPTKGYFGALIYHGAIKNVAINATPYITNGVSNVVFAYAGGGHNSEKYLTITDVSVKVSGEITTFAGLFGISGGFIKSNSLFVDLSGLAANSGYVISSGNNFGYFYYTNVYAISTLPVAKSTHWRGGVIIASNAIIPEGVTMNTNEAYFYYTLSGKNYCTFGKTIDNSATYAKGILYADLATLLANQKTADSYTGYGSTGAQFTNSAYWKMTETTVTTDDGTVTGLVPTWIAKA